MKRKDIIFISLTGILLITISLATFVNYKRYKDIDRSKIPQKVEESKSFQKWITNLKNKSLDVSADDFTLIEENEIYNTKWMTVYNIDDAGVFENFQEDINLHKDVKGVVFSPSERQYIDYRNIVKDGYLPTQIHYFGLRDDKLLDARLLDCSDALNCFFDRAYFLDNDVFVISEVSRNLDKKASFIPPCAIDAICTYTIKLHVVDLNKNSRLVYESKPFDSVLSLLIPEL